MIDDNRRIPLWFPYELSECDFGENVMLGTWTNNNVSHALCCATSRLELALLSSDGIYSFRVQDNVLCGKRQLRDSMTGDCFGRRYFIFSTNYVSLKNFESEAAYLKECASYGIDGTRLENFDSNFNAYWSNKGKITPIRVYKSFLRSGFSRSEGICLFFLAFLWICVLLKMHRNDESPPLQSFDIENVIQKNSGNLQDAGVGDDMPFLVEDGSIYVPCYDTVNEGKSLPHGYRKTARSTVWP